MQYTIIQTLAIYALPVIFAITLHEAAHGYVARLLGDPTAHLQGRVTLNPIKHIDPVGTVLVPLIILATSQWLGSGALLFGWAKPVPVNFSLLKNPKRDMRYVAAAGPLSNVLMALGWAALFKGVLWQWPEPFFLEMAQAGISTNVVLAVLNMIPILPLDGGRVVLSILPGHLANLFMRTEPYGMVVLMLLFVTNILPVLISAPVTLIVQGLRLMFNF